MCNQPSGGGNREKPSKSAAHLIQSHVWLYQVAFHLAWTLWDHDEVDSQARALWFLRVSNLGACVITWLAGWLTCDSITLMWRELPRVWFKKGFGGKRFMEHKRDNFRLLKTCFWDKGGNVTWEKDQELWVSVAWRQIWVKMRESLFPVMLGDDFKTSTGKCSGH